MRNIIREFPDSIYRLAILFWLALAPALLAASTLPDDTPVGTCVLMPLETVLTLPAVNTDTWRSPEDAYRRIVSRFIRQHHTRLSQDMLISKGEYLESLHVLIGTDPQSRTSCDRLFQHLLLSTDNSAGFTQSILMQRFSTSTDSGNAETFPAP